MAKIGIHGFGRIGRIVFRAAMERNMNIAAVNDPFINIDYMAYLLKYDSTHGRFNGTIEIDRQVLVVNNRRILAINIRNIKNILWESIGVDYVIDATGEHLKMSKASVHLSSGARKVVITTPGVDIPIIVIGANLDDYKSNMDIVSAGSATTTSGAPIAKIMDEHFGLVAGLMTSIHAVTATQRTVDSVSRKSWRTGRGFMQSIIPSFTKSSAAILQALPQLKGKILCTAYRVPTSDVSVIDFTMKLERPTEMEQIKKVFRNIANGPLKDAIGYADDDVVSQDFRTSKYSVIFDSTQSYMINSTFVKILGWFDNEYGYSHRVLDIIEHMHKIKPLEPRMKPPGFSFVMQPNQNILLK